MKSHTPMRSVAFFLKELFMSSRVFVLLVFLTFSCFTHAQNTVGLLSNGVDLAYQGFNLLFPHNQSSVFLIDNCGRIVNEWSDEGVVPGNSVYLTEEGNLVKCKRKTTSAVNDPIWAGGGGETVEIRSWENELLHEYTLNNELYRLHHDVAVLPNGNILMIAWQNRTLEESIDAGRNPESLAQQKLWSESILEWDPSIDSIIWQWDVWDHLIQDFDPSKNNFGDVSAHPEKIDINYDEHDGHPDWLHINAIDYNVTLDQIILSVPYFNELWIIDHSTTVEEVRTSEGGNAGMGGDLLYRWGNPMAYQMGDLSDKRLFFQHDTHWQSPTASSSQEEFSRVVLFNNRISSDLSTGNSLILPWDEESSSYVLEQGVYGPEDFERTVSHPNELESRSASNSLSSTQILPNGNFLMCAGRWGYSYEITPDNEIAWEYITPIAMGNRASQGDTLSINNNLTFRIKRYSESFPAFANRDISAGEYVEMNPDTSFCNMVISNVFQDRLSDIKVYPNPTVEQLYIESDEMNNEMIQIVGLNGVIYQTALFTGQSELIDVSNLYPGTYILMNNKDYISTFVKL